MKKAKLMLSIGMLAFAGMTTTLVSCGGDTACPVGYEGSDCKTLSRDKFIGTWTGKDVCTSGPYTYDMVITASSASAVNALISNPGGFGSAISISGEITDGSTLTFTNQDVGSGRTLNGKMTINGSNSSVTFDYTVTDGLGGTDDCVGTFTKK